MQQPRCWLRLKPSCGPTPERSRLRVHDVSTLSPLRVLVLGTNGQLGWQLMKDLNSVDAAQPENPGWEPHKAADKAGGAAQQEDQQRETRKPTQGMQLVGTNRAELDVGLTDRAGIEACLAALLARHQPDLVINAIAYTAVDRAEGEADLAFQVNGWFPGLLGALAHRLPVIHFSTDYVFDGKGDTPYRESDEATPLSVYGASKLQGERLLLEANNKALVLRCSWVVGAHGQNFARTILRLACERDSLRVVADQWGVPTPTAFIVEQLRSLVCGHYPVQHPVPCGVYHLVPSGETTWHAYACEILRRAKQHPAWAQRLRLGPENVEPISTAQYPTPAPRPANSRLDTTKWRAATGQSGLPDWIAAAAGTLCALLGHRAQAGLQPAAQPLR